MFLKSLSSVPESDKTGAEIVVKICHIHSKDPGPVVVDIIETSARRLHWNQLRSFFHAGITALQDRPHQLAKNRFPRVNL